jgi:hypothetical protein
MSSKTTNNETTKNKNIFITRLLEEAREYSFLGVINGTNSDIIKVLEDISGIEEIICPDRETDINCLNKFPSYRFTKSHFKPACLSYFKSYRNKWIINAVKATYIDYDPTIPYDTGDISRMVWYRYRQARRYVRQEDMILKREKRQRRKTAQHEMRRIAALKRAEKEEQQFLDLAAKNPYTYSYGALLPKSHQVFITRKNNESDKDWGMRCFNARMRSDQKVKNAKVNEIPNEAALLRVRQWMRDNPNYGDYGKDLAEEQVRFFRPDPTGADTKLHRVPNKYMRHLLICLNDQGLGDRVEWNYNGKWRNTSDKYHIGIGISVTMEWPNLNKEGFPVYTEIGYSTTGRKQENGATWSKLQGNDRTPSPFTMKVCGVLDPPTLNGPADLWKIEENHPLTLISGKKNRVHMMFPKEHAQFEHMNNAKGVSLRECRRFPTEAKITSVKMYIRAQNIVLEFLGVTKSPVESEAWKAKVTANHDNIARYFYDLNDPAKRRHEEREAKVNEALELVRATKAANAAAARESGLRKKLETTLPKIPVNEKIQRLTDLLILKDRGVITDREYNNLKTELL